jgi:hypothetical protein
LKCICCDKTKKLLHTKKYAIDTLIEHIASIFSIEDNDLLANDEWLFLNELVSRNYFTTEDLTILKDIQVLESSSELSFYEGIIASFTTQLATLGENPSAPFKASLETHLTALSLSLEVLKEPFNTKKDRQTYLLTCFDEDKPDHWSNKLKQQALTENSFFTSYLEVENEIFYYRVCKISESTSPTGSTALCF